MPRFRFAPVVPACRRGLLASLLFLATVAAAPVPARAEPIRPALPALQLSGRLQGEAAIRALGQALEQVAAHYRMSPERLREILRHDRAAWLDAQGRLLYIDDFPLQPATGAGSATPAAVDLAQTFRLHSRPGALRTLYLDFDGYSARDTVWHAGTVNARPFDEDGDPSRFSDLEKTHIQEVWQRVAEDYAPFDIDVTTEAPPAEALRRRSVDDAVYGMRVVITRNPGYDCVCGGISYVGVFGEVSADNPDYYQPAWIFYDALGGDAKNIAEAAAHEAGHTFGLSHDGTSTSEYYEGHGDGETGWAPIMGVGYYRNLTQWSRGDYPDANNHEDDLAIIATGAPLRADDVGDLMTTAAALGRDAGGVNQPGVIEHPGDVDMYRFSSAGGSVQFAATPAPLGPDLDIAMDLFDVGGRLLAHVNPENELNATLTAVLPAGDYFLAVSGTGKPDPATGYSDYGSLGHYLITGSYPPAALPTLHVQDIRLSLHSLLGRYLRCEAEVSVQDGFGNAVAGASVDGLWSGAAGRSDTAVTDGSGVALFRMPWSSNRGGCTFSVQDIGFDSYRYAPEENIETTKQLMY